VLGEERVISEPDVIHCPRPEVVVEDPDRFARSVQCHEDVGAMNGRRRLVAELVKSGSDELRCPAGCRRQLWEALGQRVAGQPHVMVAALSLS
jgi:hypothetical protein